MNYYEVIKKNSGFLLVSPLPYEKNFSLMTQVISEIGYLRKADKQTGMIIGRFRISDFGGILNTVKLLCYIVPADGKHYVVISFVDGALQRVKDKRWKVLFSKITEKAPNVSFGVKMTESPPALVGKKLLRSGDEMHLFDTGKILIKHTRTPVYHLHGDMPGIDYEHDVAEQLSRQGFLNVVVTQAGGDFGADILMQDRNGEKICVQCKQYRDPVGVKAVQEIIGAKAYYQCHRAMVITTSTFTAAAKELATSAGVELYEKFGFRDHGDDDLDWIDKIEERNAIFD